MVLEEISVKHVYPLLTLLCSIYTYLTKLVHISNVFMYLIEAIKSLYRGSSSKIKIGNLITKGFKVTKGLRQCCSLSRYILFMNM